MGDGGEPIEDVLIVGAGPTGLMAAVWLAANGVRARVVDPKPGPTPETRAVTLQARTLELWAMLGIAERAFERGRRAEATNVWVGRRVAARLPLGEIGVGISPYPFVLLLPQSETEAILYERLREMGGEVEWGVRVETVEGHRVTFGAADGPSPLPLSPGGEREFRFILGCDGASSAVRKATGLGFPGGTYSNRFFVADLDAEGGVVPREVNVVFLPDRFFAFFPLRDEGRYRMVGLLDPAFGEDATMDDVRPEIEARMGTRIGTVRGFSVYRVHHRVVERFRQGAIFLLGDAAHVHSPVGGQGMNTGLGDAVNLAWKLVEVLRHGANERLLDSYEAERRPFARSLVATTDRAFEIAVSPKPLPRFLRMRVLPPALSLALRFAFVRRLAFRTVSQTRIGYRRGPLAGGWVGAYREGDRLPPLTGEGARPDRWRLVTVGSAAPLGVDWCRARDFDVETRPGRLLAVLLVRPDGHIGRAWHEFSASVFDRYLREKIGRTL